MRKNSKPYVAAAPKGRFSAMKGGRRGAKASRVLRMKHGGPKSSRRGAIKFFTEFPGLQKNRP